MDTTLFRSQIAGITLVSATLLVVSLWGGMLSDRVNPNPEMSGVLNLAGFPLSAVLSACALAIGLWFDRDRWRVGFMSVGAGGLVGWAAVSVFGSPHLHASLAAFSILTAAVVLGWALPALRLPPAGLLGIAMALVTAASLVAALGVSEYVGHVARPPRDFSWRVFSTFATPNFLAGYLAMTIPIAAACLLAARERLVKLLCGLGLSLQAACLLLTGSRFGIVCLAAGLVIFAVLVTRRGLVQGVAGRRGRITAAVILGAALLGSIPVGIRLFRSGAESHSTLFRYYTWRGTAKMAASNPVLGTGLGSFDVAYGPYAEVAYTQHAHNTYLQLAGEAGVPAAILFLLLAGAALKVAVARARPDTGPVGAGWSDSASGLLAAGVAAGMVGGLLRNLFDSDLYVPANAFTFALLCGLASARGTPDSVSPEIPVGTRRALAAATLLIVLTLLVPYTMGRFFARGGEEAILRGDLAEATSSYKRAADFDHRNPEYLLKLAGLHAAGGDFSEAEHAYKGAIRSARAGKAYYQYARFLSQQKRITEAIEVHEKARTIEPNNLQNLLALAEAYAGASMKAEAERVYRKLVALHESPFGRIRAVPELIEYEFGAAYRALAEIELERRDEESAERTLRKGVEVLGELWSRRKNPMVQLQVRREKLLLAGERYERALAMLSALVRSRGSESEADSLEERRSRISDEIEQERAQGPGE